MQYQLLFKLRKQSQQLHCIILMLSDKRRITLLAFQVRNYCSNRL